MPGLDPREDRGRLQTLGEFLVAHPADVLAFQSGVGFALDTQFGADRPGSRKVIAGDHDGPDAGAAAILDRFLYFQPRRIDVAYQTDKDEAAPEGVEFQVAQILHGPRAVAEGQHPQGAVGQRLGLPEDRGAALGIHLLQCAVGGKVGAAQLYQLFGGAFYANQVITGRGIVHRRHQADIRIKGQLVNPRVLLA
ncbi:MAG: hypothetical protein BWY77_02013 [bacterium ADurb.Bin431]|nr:MAG: hypothetical protein BWY77_02013 [bacterium ADurb.Bin431]